MSDYGLSNYGTNGFPQMPTGNSVVDAVIRGVMMPFYMGGIVKAQARLAEEMQRLKAEERKLIISSLKEIALSTEDAQVKQQMFYTISMFGVSN